MAASILIPFTADCSHRRRALSFLLQRFDDQVVVGQSVGEWCKARAVADAARRASGDVLVVHDADVVVDLTEAIAAVEGGASWAIPHRHVHRLEALGTARVLAGEPAENIEGRDQAPAYVGVAGGGVVVLRRAQWQQIPLDPRFVGWGQEDQAWGAALATLAGEPWRGTADLFHLWHPAPPRINRHIGSETSAALFARYKHADGHPELMRTVIHEARRALYLHRG